jgi:methylenetetrahydrofolate dehydrogenase (NADP+)/methenyltetrahydrofolate cyclohydrolase
MTAKILDGRACAERIKTQVAKTIEQQRQRGLTSPGLAVILVGDDPASVIYVGHKHRACEQVGIKSIVHQLPASTNQQTLIELITRCNNDPAIHGILLQLPLPSHIKADDLLELIRPDKDVDGLHPYNLGRLVQRRPILRPCTPYGIMTLLKETRENLAGKNAVVVGASNIVGRPMALELLLAKCTVTICHSNTRDLAKHINNADILVAGIGKPNIIKSEWIKSGSIVIDAGTNRLTNGKIVGDINFELAKTNAAWITPVPGGVGPMTVATLLENTLFAANLQHDNN